MAISKVPHQNAVVYSNFVDLEVNFNTSRAEAERLLATGMTMDDIREYMRMLQGFGRAPLQ